MFAYQSFKGWIVPFKFQQFLKVWRRINLWMDLTLWFNFTAPKRSACSFKKTWSIPLMLLLFNYINGVLRNCFQHITLLVSNMRNCWRKPAKCAHASYNNFSGTQFLIPFNMYFAVLNWSYLLFIHYLSCLCLVLLPPFLQFLCNLYGFLFLFGIILQMIIIALAHKGYHAICYDLCEIFRLKCLLEQEFHDIF